MSEEQVETKEQSKEPPKEEGKPPGYDAVDLDTASKDEIQNRINFLYRQVKTNEKTAQQAIKDGQAMAERVHDLVAKVGQKDIDDAAAAIKAQIAEATERGEGQRVADLTEQLLHVKQPLPEPKKVQPQPAPDPEVPAIRSWADEQNPDGSHKRPWTQEGHPYQVVAANVGAGVMQHPEWQHRPLNERLQEIDRRMNAEMGVPSAPAVLDGGNPRPKSKETELTQDQKRVAWNMRADLSQAEAEKWYAKALKGVS